MPYKTYESHLGRNTDIPVDDKWIRQVGESSKIPKNLIIKFNAQENRKIKYLWKQTQEKGENKAENNNE